METTAPPSPAGVRPDVARFRRDIQGLRGVAVILVVLFHAGGIAPGGFIGVDVFFVLSGFLIGGLLHDEFERTGRIYLAGFFTRRARRLLPAQAAAVIGTLVLALFLLDAWTSLGQAVRTAIGTSLFAANLQLYLAGDYFAPSADLNPLLHTWSLAVEEQFYLGFALVFAVLGVTLRSHRGNPSIRSVIGLILTVVLAASLALSLILSPQQMTDFSFLSEPQRFAFYSPLTRAWQFLAGALLSIVVAEQRSRGPATRGRWVHSDALRTSLAAGGLLALAVQAASIDGSTPWPGTGAILTTACTLLILAQPHGAEADGLAFRILSWRPLVKAGDVSYSWYLWHWPFIVVAREAVNDEPGVLLAAGVVALVPALLSLRLVEDRFRRRTDLTGRRAAILAALCMALPLAAAGTAHLVGAHARSLPQGIGTLNARAADEAAAAAAASAVASATRLGDADIVVVGDSHAMALHAGIVAELAGTTDAPKVASRMREGCLFLTGVSTGAGCADWQADVLDEILSVDVDDATLVFAGYSTGRLTGFRRGTPSTVDLFDSRQDRINSPEVALQAYKDALREIVGRVTDRGWRVILVSAVPDFPTGMTPRVPAVAAILGIDTAEYKVVSIPVDVARQRSSPLLTIEREVARDHPGVHVLDPIPLLCDETCDQIVEGMALYRDHDHLSVEGARRLARWLMENLQRDASP